MTQPCGPLGEVEPQGQGHGELRVVCSPVLLGGGQLLVFACATAVRNGP